MDLPRLKLLIADDEVHIRTGLQVGIDWDALQIEKVFTARDGSEAFELCKKHRIELVITDVKMPGLNGIELGKQLTGFYSPVKILIMSGYAEFNFAKEALKIGAVDYMLKPVNIDELIARIKEMQSEIYTEISVKRAHGNAAAGKLEHEDMMSANIDSKGLFYHQKHFGDDSRLSIVKNTFHPMVLMSIDYINLNYNKKISVESIAKYVDKSCNYFSSNFKKSIGMSFTDYLNLVRITMAKSMLKNTTLMTYEISDHVGFNDYKYFSAVFKKFENCTPSVYRTRNSQ